MLRFVTPNLRVESVLELRPELLQELNIDNLLLDVDCTLTRYRVETLDERVCAWLAALREAQIGVCLVSNGRGPRIARLARTIALPHIARALKPFPFGCARGMCLLAADRRRTAMVGDQIFADVLAGRLAGLYTILVRPLNPEDEPWFTRLKRPLERVLIHRLNRIEKRREELVRDLPKPLVRPERPIDEVIDRR